MAFTAIVSTAAVSGSRFPFIQILSEIHSIVRNLLLQMPSICEMSSSSEHIFGNNICAVSVVMRARAFRPIL